MDRVFEQVDSCPFANYANSLDQFARAIYKLKLENGRCYKPGIPRECGFYDPNKLYPVPPARTVNLASVSKPVSGEIVSSYGIDFIDVIVGSDMNGQSLSIEVANAPGADTEFSVHVLEIKILNDDPLLPAYMVQLGQPAAFTETTGSGTLEYRIDGLDLDNVDCIGLIITRLDGNEKGEAGEYELKFQVQ